MNSLGIDLTKGQKVVMEGNCPEEQRTVTLEGGFGMGAKSRGSTVFVTLPNGLSASMDSMEIERLAE